MSRAKPGQRRKPEGHAPARREALQVLALLPVLPSCLRQLVYRPQVLGQRLLVPNAELAQLRADSDLLALRAPELPTAILLRRRANGTFVAVQALCTHRSCELTALPGSFECPCHGSRFDAEGQVLEGPAERPLPRFEVRSTKEGCEVLLPTGAPS